MNPPSNLLAGPAPTVSVSQLAAPMFLVLGSALAACTSSASGSGGMGGALGVSGSGAMSDDAGGPEAGAAAPSWDWAGIVGTGQSLSVGAQAPAVASTTQPFGNLKLVLASNPPPFDPDDPGLSTAPLVEPIRPFATTYPSAYPANIYGETPHTAMANQISALSEAAGRAPYVSVHSVIGENGQPMSVLRKGATEVVDGATSMGRAYAATEFEVAALTRLAREQGLSYGVGGVIITHGESDAGSTAYAGDLFRLWSDYDRDLRAITGQTEPILMIVNQQHSVPEGVGFRSASTQGQWRASVDHADEIVCSGPKYQYAYAPDAVHLVTLGYQMLGEKSGQVYFERVVLGSDWQPLQPLEVQSNGSVVSVRFHVPVPPLAFDEELPAPHQVAELPEWAAGRGFEIWQGARRVGIASVAIVGDDTLEITADEAIGAGFTLGYAATHDGVTMPGGTGRWGQLRDSDPFVGSTTGRAQPNYAVAFELAIP